MDANSDQSDSAKETDPELFADQKFDDEANAKTRDGAINGVRRAGSQARDDAGHASFAERPRDTEHVYGPYRRRDGQSGYQAFDEKNDVIHYAIGYLSRLQRFLLCTPASVRELCEND